MTKVHTPAKTPRITKKAAQARVVRNAMIRNGDREDIQLLVEMTSYARPSRKQESPVYKEFLEKFIEPIMGPHDGFYNYMLVVPDAQGNHPRIAYMAHHDTVHTECFRQSDNMFVFEDDDDHDYTLYVHTKEEVITEKKLVKRWDQKSKAMVDVMEEVTIRKPLGQKSNCLGADCTTGLWLILEMVKAGIPGVYVIHNDEEIGRKGAEHIVERFTGAKKSYDMILSSTMAQYLPDTLLGGWDSLTDEQRNEMTGRYSWVGKVDIAMSFDRKSYGSIITRQSCGVCASPEFVDSLSAMISPHFEPFGYKTFEADTGGSYTDSASYIDLISECTNLSVGYFSQHTSNETQDLTYASILRDFFVTHGADLNDPTKLIAARDKTKRSYAYGGNDSYGSYGGGFGAGYSGRNSNYFDDDYYDTKSAAPSGGYKGPKATINPASEKKGTTGEVIALPPPKDDIPVMGRPSNTTNIKDDLEGFEDLFTRPEDFIGGDDVGVSSMARLMNPTEADLYEQVAEDDTVLETFVCYAVSLGATYQGLVNYAIAEEVA